MFARWLSQHKRVLTEQESGLSGSVGGINRVAVWRGARIALVRINSSLLVQNAQLCSVFCARLIQSFPLVQYFISNPVTVSEEAHVAKPPLKRAYLQACLTFNHVTGPVQWIPRHAGEADSFQLSLFTHLSLKPSHVACSAISPALVGSAQVLLIYHGV